MIHRVALQAADVHGIVHHAAAAVVLTGVLAHVGAGKGEGIVFADQAHGIVVAACPHQRDVAGNVHMGRAHRDAGHRVAQAADAAAMQHVLLVIFPEAPYPLQHHMGSLIADGAVRRVGDDLGGALDQINGFQGGGAVQHALDQNGQLAQAHPAGYAFAAGLRVGKAHEVQRHVHRAQPRRRGVDAPAHLPVKAVQNDLGLAGMFNGKSAQKNSPFGSAAKRQTVGHMPVQTGGAQARVTRRI